MKSDLVCASGVELLMDYLEGSPAVGPERDLEAHVSGCPAVPRSWPPIGRRRASCARPPRSRCLRIWRNRCSASCARVVTRGERV
jgi:hypothetical protein